MGILTLDKIEITDKIYATEFEGSPTLHFIHWDGFQRPANLVENHLIMRLKEKQGDIDEQDHW